jgi:hypothetical protein
VLTELLKKFFADIRLSEPEKLHFDADYPVSIKQGINEEGKHIVYFLNYSATGQTIINTCNAATELIGGTTIAAGESISLAPWDVAVLEFA